MRTLLNRIPFYYKLLVVIFLSVFSFVGVLLSFKSAIFSVVSIENELLFNQQLLHVMLKHIAVGLFLITGIWVGFYWDLKYQLEYFNDQLLNSVVKKRMKVNFDEFQAQDIFGSIASNATQLFDLYREYDGMKSSRLSMEVTTVKQLMNSIDEGVILVSIDRLVTHINHHAETMLRFVPGEVLGQAVSRFISQSDVLNAIDDCLDNGIKTASLEAVMSDEESYL